jgi:hypothetical protein
VQDFGEVLFEFLITVEPDRGISRLEMNTPENTDDSSLDPALDTNQEEAVLERTDTDKDPSVSVRL